jgi:hypothetical protein
VAGVCFASRTERPPPLASEATLGDEREANPGRYRPLTVFDRGKGKAAGSLHGRRLCCVWRFLSLADQGGGKRRAGNGAIVLAF